MILGDMTYPLLNVSARFVKRENFNVGKISASVCVQLEIGWIDPSIDTVVGTTTRLSSRLD